MRVTIVGAGYVGLVSAACLAELGHEVCCLDVDRDRIAMLRAGGVPIHEIGLEELIATNMASGDLRFEFDYSEAVPGSDVVILAVGTPPAPGGAADLSAVTAATRSIAKVMDSGTTVVVKSTVPVGTTQGVAEQISMIRPDIAFDVASNPEFLRQGSAVADFLEPSRIVVGTRSEQGAATMRRLYSKSIAAGAPTLFTGIETAELIKYASNAFLAVKLSFINEIADLCEEAGCDVGDVTTAMGLDPRIGNQFLAPGPGYGGSCLPKDTMALMETAWALGVHTRVVEAASDVNERRPARMGAKVESAVGGSVGGKRIGVLGLTFKAGTNDLRESPALAVIRWLLGRGAEVRAYDPHGMAAARDIVPGARFASDPYECARDADAVVILTEWSEFSSLDLSRLAASVAQPVIVDTRNLYDPAAMADAGFSYHSIGR